MVLLKAPRARLGARAHARVQRLEHPGRCASCRCRSCSRAGQGGANENERRRRRERRAHLLFSRVVLGVAGQLAPRPSHRHPRAAAAAAAAGELLGAGLTQPPTPPRFRPDAFAQAACRAHRTRKWRAHSAVAAAAAEAAAAGLRGHWPAWHSRGGLQSPLCSWRGAWLRRAQLQLRHLSACTPRALSRSTVTSGRLARRERLSTTTRRDTRGRSLLRLACERSSQPRAGFARLRPRSPTMIQRPAAARMLRRRKARTRAA